LDILTEIDHLVESWYGDGLSQAVQPTRGKSRSSWGNANDNDAEADNLWAGLEVIKSL